MAAAPSRFPAFASGPAGAATASAPAAAVKLPPMCWTARQAESIEKELDAFFAETDPAKRAGLHREKLAGLPIGLTLDELETIARSPPLEGEKKKRGYVRMKCDWLKDNDRGWFNIALPKNYSPAKACPLAVIMHGSSADGDNMPTWYTPKLNDAGFITIYPTTTDVGRYWGDEVEVANIFRLIDWAARRYRVDFRRLVCTGGSMGGVGTWSMILQYPQLWSCASSVAGYPAATQGEILENIRGIPFYFVHGDEDHIPVSGPRAASADLKRRGIAHVYVEAPGEKHTPSMKYWTAMTDWLIAQGPKWHSPRPLFLPAGGRPLWRCVQDPLGLNDPDDPVIALIRQGKTTDAAKAVQKRLADKVEPARAQMLLALNALPCLLDPYPYDLDAGKFDQKKGWNTTSENKAIEALARAIAEKDGRGPFPAAFERDLRLLLIKIHLKRVAQTAATPAGWVAHWDALGKQFNVLGPLGSSAESDRLFKAAQAIIVKHGHMKIK
ncbi:MAG: prolyl oligopeptidase family serine peptidase [Planctomycetes bacterium]|nr:prolyl oligopeptidase family serine peptidase [Planctomycetota bacterium]